jgi:hypothetical protein
MIRLRSLLLLSALSLVAASARADENRRAVILPTELGGYFPKKAEWRREFDITLTDRLKTARINVLEGEPLTKEESECRDQSCLAAIAEHHQVDVVVSARVVNDEQAITGYKVEVSLVDRSPTGTAFRTRDNVCKNCSEIATREMLAETLSEALAGTPPKPPTDGNHTPKHPEPKSLRRPIYITLGVVGVAGTIASVIALGVKADEYHQPDCSGTIPPGRQCPYVKNTSGAIITSSVVGALSLGLAVYSFVMASRPDPKHHAWIAPTFGEHSAGMIVGGRF